MLGIDCLSPRPLIQSCPALPTGVGGRIAAPDRARGDGRQLANNKSAIKRVRQAEARRSRNRSVRTRVRNVSKTVLQAAAPGKDPAALTDALRAAQSIIDRAAKHGVLHRRAAARRKSRLARRAQAALTADGA